MTASRGMRSDRRRLAFVLVLVVALAPNLVWIFVDKTAWSWDQAWYAKNSVELFCTLLYDPADWIPAMLSALGRQAPGITWAGQFFVPLGLLVGSIDAGLLLSIFAAQAAALFLTAAALRDLSNGRTSSAAAGAVAMAAAPLFIGLGHQYLVETMQTTAVAWFVLIMARAHAWSRLTTGVHLSLATSLAMLAKASSPLYCFVPGLVGLYYLVRPGNQAVSSTPRRAPVALGLAILLAVATVAWYYRNGHAVAVHVAMASSGSVAELYGKNEPFLPSLLAWLAFVQANFFSVWTTVPVAVTILAAVGSAIAKPRIRGDVFLMAAVVSAIEILATLSVFSLNSNRDDRYLAPLVPYVAVIVGWSVTRLERRAFALALTALFGIQWAHAQAQTFGVVHKAVGSPPGWLGVRNGDSGPRILLDALVQRTCSDRTSDHYRNAVGVQLIWLNPPALAYTATKQFAPYNTLRCDYDAVAYYEADLEHVWNSLMGRPFTYYIALDPATYTIPEGAADKTVNQWNEPILRRVMRSGLFALEPGLDEHPGVMIFKRDRSDLVTNGRALSDRGHHDEAIDALKRAAEMEPGNVEALANLALALERASLIQEAVAAGERARQLAPDHYWVNLGLARTLFLLSRWTEAADRAQHAAAHAPGVAERVSALTLGARSAIGGGDRSTGCGLLRQAAGLQPTREIQDEIAGSRCATR